MGLTGVGIEKRYENKSGASTARHRMRGERKSDYAWSTLRIAFGATFAWAFLDKLLGLGYSTAPANAWLAGGSPTYGFLQFGTAGPLAGFYQTIAGHPVTDALFMIGLLAIGVSLLLGVGVRVAGYSGALMMLLTWSARLPPETNPLIDDHIVYAVALIGLTLVGAGRTWGLGEWWSRQEVVKKYPLLE